MGRIDAAIAACEKVQNDCLNGRFPSWADFVAARDAAESEYCSALSELSIRASRRAMAEYRAAKVSNRCNDCGGAKPVTGRLDCTGECDCDTSTPSAAKKD